MPKLDLTTAKRIKVAGGEALAIKGAGFSWTRPTTALPETFTYFTTDYGLWADAEGTIPAVVDGPIMRWSCQGKPGYDFVQSDIAAAPYLRQDVDGQLRVSFLLPSVFLRSVKSTSAFSGWTAGFDLVGVDGGGVFGIHNGLGNNRRLEIYANSDGTIALTVQQGSTTWLDPSPTVFDGQRRRLSWECPAGSSYTTVEQSVSVDRSPPARNNLYRGNSISSLNLDIGQTSRSGADFSLYKFCFSPAASNPGDHAIVQDWLYS